MAIEVFTRREQKYLITKQQYQALIKKLNYRMRPDLNGIDGRYTVTSLYFDNEDRDIYYETKNRLRFRQKLRLRVYDDTDINGTAFFEVKQKHNKVVNKRRMILPLQEAYRYLSYSPGESREGYETSNTQVLREIDHFRWLYQLEPEMIVSYDRHALHEIDNPDLRITFDFNMRTRNDNFAVEDGPYGDNFVDTDLVILEVKVDDSVPLWLTRILQEVQCDQRGASKFCTSLEFLNGEITVNEALKERMTIGGF